MFSRQLIILLVVIWGCDSSNLAPPDDDTPSPDPIIDLGQVETLLQFPDLNDNSILIENITIIDNVTGTTILAQDVLIIEDQIDQIGQTGSLDHSANQIIDGKGKYLIPGLSDMHTHPVTISNVARNDLFLFLAHGVTTIRVLWGFDAHLRLRDSITNRQMLGPNMIIGSQGFVGTSPLWPGSVQTATLEEVETKVKEFADKGYDFLKVYSGLSSSQYQKLLDEADRLGIPAAGHIPSTISLSTALASNQSTIEHLGAINNNQLTYTQIAQQLTNNNIWVCPTLAVANRSVNLIEQYQQDPIYLALSQRFKNWLQEPITRPVSIDPSQFLAGQKFKLGQLNDANAPIISGTDMGIRYVLPGKSLHEELFHYVEAGLTPLEALNTSTINAQQLIGKQYPGSVQEGMLADLVILNQNPLENIGNLSDLDGVIKSGYYLSKADIDSIIEALIAAN